MFQDALTLRAYLAEVIQRYPLPWFVQKFSQVGESDFLLSARGAGQDGQLATRRWLISLTLQGPSFRLWCGPKPQALPASSFTMLVRKYLQGRTLESLESLYPERLARWVGHQHILWLELLERQPNLVLTDREGSILGAFRGGKALSRDLRPRRPYQLPPRPALPDAETLTPYQLEEIYLADPPSWPKSLLQHSFGLSPGACAFLAGRFQGLQSLPESWRALWAYTRSGYSAQRLPGGQLSIWGGGLPGTLLDLTLEEQTEATTLPGLEQHRQRLLQTLARARQKLHQRLEKLQGDFAKVGQAEELQREGELLLTYQAQVVPGADQVELTDWDGQTRLRIRLDPALPVVLQAQKRLKRAAKFRRSLPILEARRQETLREIARIEETEFQVKQAEGREEFPELKPRKDVRKAASLSAGPSSGPRRYGLGPFTLLVGRTPKQNDELIRRHSARDDLWFHVKDAPGAHVLLKTAGASPEQEVVEAAAVLAARYSSKSSENKVLVGFTSAQRVKKPAGSAPGFVVYYDELTLWVSPAQLPAGLERL